LSLCSCHCIVCPSVYGFWLPLQTFLVFMFLPLYCVSFGLRLLIIPSSFSLSLCSCNCVVCSSVYGFWLPLQAFLVFMFLPLYCVSFDLRLLITIKNCLVFMFFPLYCVSFGLRLLITPSSFSLFLCSCNCIVCPSVYGFWLTLQAFLCLYVLVIVLCVLWFTASD
jgi:hypothetical protein